MIGHGIIPSYISLYISNNLLLVWETNFPDKRSVAEYPNHFILKSNKYQCSNFVIAIFDQELDGNYESNEINGLSNDYLEN